MEWCLNETVGYLINWYIRHYSIICNLFEPYSSFIVGFVGRSADFLIQQCVFWYQIKCQAESVNCKEGLRRLFVSNNLGSLFAGIGTAAFCSCLVGAVYFCTYAAAKRVAKNMIFDPNDPQRSHGTLGIEVFASLCSWAATALVDAPVEMLRHQTQVELHVYASLCLICLSILNYIINTRQPPCVFSNLYHGVLMYVINTS